MKKTILLIDDFQNTLFVTEMTLQNDYKILKAKSGQEAMDIMKNNIPDLIITDYNMPVMNGYDLVKEIKKNPDFKRIPIFVLSTETKQELKAQILELGVTAWIQKPFKLDILKQLIKKAI